jgi:hypothetical protein
VGSSLRSLANARLRQQNSRVVREPLEKSEEFPLKSAPGKLQSALSGLVVIVAGVLLALAGDAAWSSRGDRIREQEVLADLLEEFTENEAILLSDIDANRKAVAAARVWGDVMLGHAAAPPDSLHSLLLAAQDDARFDPLTGALRSLVDGGELQLIRNSELRRALAGWGDRTAEARLTAQSWDRQRQSLVSLVLSFPSGPSLTPRQRSAVLLTVRTVAGQNSQLEGLVDEIREIITMVQGEIDG